MKTIKIIPVIITILIFAFLFSGCQLEDIVETESKPKESTSSTVSQTDDTKEITSEDKRIDIRSQEFVDLVVQTFKDSTKDNKYFSYSFYSTRSQYIEISIEPNGKYDDETFLIHAKDVTKKVLEELKKNEYKTGGLFGGGYDTINVFFLNYGDYNSGISRSNAAFIRIKPLEIQNATEEDLSF